MSSLAVLHASQLVTLAGPKRPRVRSEMSELAIVHDGGMLVHDGVIVAIGSSTEIERSARQSEIVDASGRVVLPGFVDAHAHPVFAGNRLDDFERRARGKTYEQIAAAGGGIWSTVEKTRAASEMDLLNQAKKHANWFLECGTTTVEAKSGYGECRADEYVDLVNEEMLPAVGAERLAEFCDVFCEHGYFDIEQSRKILAAAKRLGLKLRIHADQLTNSGAAQLAAELEATTADHLEKTDEDGFAAMKASGVQPVLLPGSVYALGSTCYPRAREMIEAGLAVVIATDFNPGSSPSPSMPMMLSLACTQMKMSPAEAIAASTINAAYSLDRGDKIGSLEQGKLANFSIFDCEDYREIAYWFGFPQIHSVYVRGRPVLSRANET